MSTEPASGGEQTPHRPFSADLVPEPHGLPLCFPSTCPESAISSRPTKRKALEEQEEEAIDMLDTSAVPTATASPERESKRSRQGSPAGSDVSPEALAVQWLRGTIFAEYLSFACFEVGPNHKPFIIHECALRKRCPAFLEWYCSQDNQLTNPPPARLNVLSSTFRLFVIWLHTNHIPPLADRPEPEDDVTPEDRERSTSKHGTQFPRDLDLTRLYIFATSQGITELANQALTTLILVNNRKRITSTKATIQLLLDTYGEDCSLLQLFVEETAFALDATTLSANLLRFPEPFVMRVMLQVLKDRDSEKKQIPSKNERRRRVCDYHSHSDLEEQDRCRKAIPATATIIKTLDEMAKAPDPYQETGVVVVGSEGLHFTVHKGLIGHHSEYFHSAFGPDFAEGKKNEVVLEEESSDVFALFMYWLYNQHISLPTLAEYEQYEGYVRELEVDEIIAAAEAPAHAPGQHASPPPSFEVTQLADQDEEVARDIKQEPESESEEDSDSESEENSDSESENGEDEDKDTEQQRHLRTLVELYIFADRRGVRKLRNDVIDYLSRCRAPSYPLLSSDPDLVSTIFASQVPSHSRLCQYVADEALCNWTAEMMESIDFEELPPAFSAKLLGGLLLNKGHAPPTWPPEDLCPYHEHADMAETQICQEERP